ncbi:MAG: histidine phosphatase family protein [Verrucomicrobiota bacterium]|nr:histidine phosphatase family protein [Verrucomicrobiota bacterium]
MFCREKPTRLHLVRHGEVDEAYHEVFGGQIDMELSPNGHEQAKCLAKFLGRRHFDRVYRSPMVRVRQTAEPLLDALGREAEVIDDLREVDFGVWTGYKWDEIQENFNADAEDWLLHLENNDIAEAESMDGYRSRIQCSLDRMMNEGAEQDLLVLCHGGVIRMLLSLLLDESFSKMDRYEVDFASLTVIEHRTSRVEIKLHNFAPWLWLRENGGA